jgi:tetratricopeptide (TPR) repeat protein
MGIQPLAIDLLETSLRQGDVDTVARHLNKLNISRLSKTQRVRAARFARRAGMLTYGFRCLGFVAQGIDDPNRFSPDEVAEYATLLIHNGGVEEALRILGKLSSLDHPSLLTALAWCHFTKWDYNLAVEPLAKALNLQGDSYWRLALKINLAEAYFGSGRFTQCLKLLSSSVREAESQQSQRLWANALHLRARCYFELNELEKSNRDLNLAWSKFSRLDSPDGILIKRQMVINQAFMRKSVEPLNAFRSFVSQLGAWESLRECDYQKLRIRPTRSLFEHLYYGTPYLAYRRRVREAVSYELRGNDYIWGERNVPTLDLANSQLTRQNQIVLDTFLRDFYRPLNVGRIFSALFPNEHFSYFHSSTRVHQILKRFRKDLRSNNIPLKVNCSGGLYTIIRTQPYSIRIPRNLRESECRVEGIDWLAQIFPKGRKFSVQEACPHLKLSKATLCRLMAQGLSENKIRKHGRGRTTKYSVESG